MLGFQQKDEIEQELDADIASVMDKEYGCHNDEPTAATSSPNRPVDTETASVAKQSSVDDKEADKSN